MPTAEQRFVSFPNKYGPYERLICAYQEAREINDELEELLKNTFARYVAITALPKRLRHSM